MPSFCVIFSSRIGSVVVSDVTKVDADFSFSWSDGIRSGFGVVVALVTGSELGVVVAVVTESELIMVSGSGFTMVVVVITGSELGPVVIGPELELVIT